MDATVVSSQHSAISSDISEKSQGWWLRPNARYAAQYLHVRQHVTFMLRRASVKAQAENLPQSKWDGYPRILSSELDGRRLALKGLVSL